MCSRISVSWEVRHHRTLEILDVTAFRLRCLHAGWTLYKGFRIRLVIVFNVFVLVFHGYAQNSDKQAIYLRVVDGHFALALFLAQLSTRPTPLALPGSTALALQQLTLPSRMGCAHSNMQLQ